MMVQKLLQLGPLKAGNTYDENWKFNIEGLTGGNV